MCTSKRGLFVRVGRCRTHDGYGISNGRHTSFTAGRAMRKRVDDDDDGGEDSSYVEPPGNKALGSADAHAAKVALSRNSLPSKASGLSTGRRGSHPAVSDRDSALAGQPVTAVLTQLNSRSTSSSSGGESEGLQVVSRLAPGNCLDSHSNKKVCTARSPRWYYNKRLFCTRLGLYLSQVRVYDARQKERNKKSRKEQRFWSVGQFTENRNGKRTKRLPERKFCGRDLDLKMFNLSGEGCSVFTNSTRCFSFAFFPWLKFAQDRSFDR